MTTTLAAEFSDVPDAAQLARIVVRLCMTALLGGLLGWERKHAGKAAGVRTHMLVAMGAALLVLVAQQADIAPADNSRVLQGVIAEVGFLGAGTLLKGNAESQVKGLTTAAGIWLTAAIGLATGLGREATALLSTLLAQLVLWTMPAVHAAPAGQRKPGPAQLPPRSHHTARYIAARHDPTAQHRPSLEPMVRSPRKSARTRLRHGLTPLLADHACNG